ncbi:hypothetical protein IX314_001229 [Fusobacterium sp. DD26]|uniref:hypothetical protein n=1 Tax=Fusobacterium sp. DD26 TaxID=2789595 RepID=UPI001B8C0E6C|nr:hypothetical protein [Fusobacterium sp. DD26]MBR8701471.1 hypothetical protein [Fusobacterium sp. DD45]MBR8751765.1 hypothetical protein [Fusobacterium sp. DD26]
MSTTENNVFKINIPKQIKCNVPVNLTDRFDGTWGAATGMLYLDTNIIKIFAPHPGLYTVQTDIYILKNDILKL